MRNYLDYHEVTYGPSHLMRYWFQIKSVSYCNYSGIVLNDIADNQGGAICYYQSSEF